MSPSDLAVLRLITSSNLIGSRTRSSLGSATRSPTSRELSATFSREASAPPPQAWEGLQTRGAMLPTIYLEPFEHELAARLSVLGAQGLEPWPAD
jgi:hypothetical protein